MTSIDYAPLGIITSSGAEMFECRECGSATANRELHSRSHGVEQTFETVPEPPASGEAAPPEELPSSGEDSPPE